MSPHRSAWILPLFLAGAAPACGGAPLDGSPEDPSLDDAPLGAGVTEQSGDWRRVWLGRLLFTDENLSSPPGQSCATCHDPDGDFVDPRGEGPTSRGALPFRFGARNTPTAAYASFAPPLHREKDEDADEELWVGGLFLDGRAATLEEQAKGPLLNPLEMNNADRRAVVQKVRAASYAGLFRRVFGAAALDDVDGAFGHVAEAIAAFERSSELRPFTSRYDLYLQGWPALSAKELRGLRLFEDPKKGNCAACHPSRPGKDGSPPLFTDFSYDNLGVPKNPENPFYGLPPGLNPEGRRYVDRGLGAVVKDPAQDGKFRVPTLRNVARTAPYMHNGVFEDLWQVVDFYNTRDARLWPPPEVPSTVNREELGRLGLTAQEVDDIVAFMGALSDGFE